MTLMMTVGDIFISCETAMINWCTTIQEITSENACNMY